MLRQRLIRFTNTARLAFEERGFFAGTRFLMRSARRKFGLLIWNRSTNRDITKFRVHLDAERAQFSPKTPHIALAVTGGLGDLLVIARFMRDIGNAVGEIRFNVFSSRPSMVSWVFRYIPGFSGAYYDNLFDLVMADHDVAFRANQFVVTYAERLHWNALRRNPKMAEVVLAIIRGRLEVHEFVEPHPYQDHRFAEQAVGGGWSRRDYMQHLADVPYGGNRLKISTARDAITRFGLHGRKYVTVHNGFDTDFVVTGQRATKCYPHFGRVVAIMRAARPDLFFVQLGTVTSEVIVECDLNLISKTSFGEVAELIGGATLHLDNEGGLVHLAACLGTLSTVVFGPTPSDYFGYPENINIEPLFCGRCWWTTRSWMDHCAKGYEDVRCLTEQPPENVACQALTAIAPAGNNKATVIRSPTNLPLCVANDVK